MSEPGLSDKERLLAATRAVMINIMEKGRELLDTTGNPLLDKEGNPRYSQPSAADIQAALKLLHREEQKSGGDNTNPFEAADNSVKQAIEETKAAGVPGLPPLDDTDEEWKP